MRAIAVVVTSDTMPEHISRVHEVANKISADYYICINGDEPLVSPECISQIIPKRVQPRCFFGGAVRLLTNPAETIDFAQKQQYFTLKPDFSCQLR